MKEKKEYYKKLNPNGFKWHGFINGLHLFVKQVNRKYLSVQCNESDLNNGNIDYMTKNLFTR